MRRAALTTLLGAVTALSLSIPAFADDPPPLPPPAPQPAPAPPPPAAKPGRLKLEIAGGLSARGRQYVLKGDNVTVIGHVKPAAAGQTIRVRISTPHRKPTVVHTRIRGGTFK